MYILPEPKQIRQTSNNKFIISYYISIILERNCGTEFLVCAKQLKEHIKNQLGFTPVILKGESAKDSIFLCTNSAMQNEEYQLEINESSIVITGGDYAGVLYGIQTLKQIIETEGTALPCIFIQDKPAMKNRGFYHDVTRGRIPTLAFLKTLADKLCRYKMNQLQLYIEHSFLFHDFSEVWRDDTPLTSEDIMEFDIYCRERNIELVPSIACFGHLYKVLRTKTYCNLCELPDCETKSFSFIDRMAHHTLDITNEESFLFVSKMIDEFLPLFSSVHFNICADETFDLGKGKSKSLADEIGINKMYLNFVNRVCTYVASKGKVPMFWGDIICAFPEALNELPKETICLNWGYAPDQTDDAVIWLEEAGAAQYVCPGVGGWNQLIPLYESAYKNIVKMCQYGKAHHAIGVLNTDWGDYGHINHPEFSTTGMIYGAAFSWNERSIEFETINQMISWLEYGDRSGKFVKLLADLSKESIFSWRPAVAYKETKEGTQDDQNHIIFAETLNLSEIHTANENILDLQQTIYQLIPNLDIIKREKAMAYLVAAEGIFIWNEIGAAVSHSGTEPTALAGRLEYWFHRYKELWYSVSKESELYQIRNVIFWYADYLRTMK